MTRFIRLAAATAVVASASAPAAAAGLEAYLWKSRPVVVFAPSADAPEAVEQLKRLADARKALADRDMPVLLVTDRVTAASGGAARGDLDAVALRKAYGVARNGFAVVLVGKDGGEKLRAEEPVGAEKLTALVDTMPMRAREAR